MYSLDEEWGLEGTTYDKSIVGGILRQLAQQVLSVFVFLMVLPLSSRADATLELHKYLLVQDTSIATADLDVVKQFISNGANVSELGPTGGNAVNVAIESWAYVSVDPSKTGQRDELFKIVKFLIGEGSDPGQMDWRGLSPLITVRSWAARGPEFDRMVRLILENAQGFDQVSADGRGLIHYYASGALPELGLELMDLGMPIRLIDRHGRAFSHLSVLRGEYKGYHFLKEIFQRLLPNERRFFAELPTAYGMRPLHFAAMQGSLSSAKYLIESLRVETSPMTLGGETPLDLALREGKSEMVSYLASVGAFPFQTVERPLSCSHQNISMEVTYSSIKKLVESCGVKSIKHLLKLLPASYLSQHLTAYFTLAAQEASPDFPQIVTFGRNGKIFLSFNGHPSQDGYKGLDIIEFNDRKKTFELRAITFPESRFGKADFSELNPARCIGCHGASPRPLWNSWTFWPGKFGAEVDHIFPKERTFFKRYQKNRSSGRYAELPPLSLTISESVYGLDNPVDGQNTRVDWLIDGLNSQRIARELAESTQSERYRYAILGALSCDEDISKFIPEKDKRFFPVSFEYLRRDTFIKSDEEELSRLALLKRTLGVDPQSRYVLQAKLFRNRYSGTQAGRNFDVNRTAWVRYVLEHNFYAMSTWSTNFNNGKNSYSPQFHWAGVERFAWKELLDPIRDSELVSLYTSRESSLPKSFVSTNVFYRHSSSDSVRVCSLLKQKSLTTLLVGIH